jgi:hypothetical protein
LDPDQFEIVSTFEHFHFTKTHPAYYAEMLGRLGWPDGPVIMVGNDMERDILPAKLLGLSGFHFDGQAASGSGPEADSNGDLQSLQRMLESNNVEQFMPVYKSKESILGILSSTPAVLHSMMHELSDPDFGKRGRADDWNLTELLCHLRDTELEIHHAQIKLMVEQTDAFIPRPDTGVWASQRDYFNESGISALDGFIDARRKTMDLLQGVAEDNWQRRARHAIFGPTNFTEVVGFIADHDRMHVQQAGGLLESVK